MSDRPVERELYVVHALEYHCRVGMYLDVRSSPLPLPRRSARGGRRHKGHMRDADGPEMRDGRWPMRGAKAEAEGRKRETESATRSLVRCRSVAVGVRLSGAWSVPVARVYYIPEVICDFVHTCDRVCGVPVVVGSRVPMRDECMYSMTPMRNGIPPSPTVISMRDILRVCESLLAQRVA